MLKWEAPIKYIPPFGSSDPEQSFQNGDPTIGRQGSIPPAAVFENPQREIVNVITKSQFTPTDADLLQLAKSVRSQRLNFAEDTGSDSNLNVAFDPPLTSYTPGLVIRVLVKFTNTTDAVRINAGAGNVFIRKMNGADVGTGQLEARSIITLVYDGVNFQLTNFGGAGGGPGDVFRVFIPYDEDRSTTPGIVRAMFSPPFTDEPAAGEVIIIKIRNTNPGPIRLRIDNLLEKAALPNGGEGDEALQGDMHAGDVAILVYDGNAWWFTPNPEIDANIVYMVGPSQQYVTVAEGMSKIQRKTIGAAGYVTFEMIAGTFGPINTNHPSGDRICIRGTMTGPNLGWNNFAATGNGPSARAQDAIFNFNLLQGRFGTKIELPSVSHPNYVIGVTNSGPGRVRFENLWIIGSQIPMGPAPDFWSGQTAIDIPAGKTAIAVNCAAWGCGRGFRTDGDLWCHNCFVCASIIESFGVNSAFMQLAGCGAFGGERLGINSNSGSLLVSQNCVALMNNTGFTAGNNSSNIVYYGTATGNSAADMLAQVTSSVVLWYTYSYTTTSPVLNVIGNLGSVVAIAAS